MDKCFYSLYIEMLYSQTGIIYIRSAYIQFLLISSRGDHAQIMSLIQKKNIGKNEKMKQREHLRCENIQKSQKCKDKTEREPWQNVQEIGLSIMTFGRHKLNCIKDVWMNLITPKTKIKYQFKHLIAPKLEQKLLIRLNESRDHPNQRESSKSPTYAKNSQT